MSGVRTLIHVTASVTLAALTSHDSNSNSSRGCKFFPRARPRAPRGRLLTQGRAGARARARSACNRSFPFGFGDVRREVTRALETRVDWCPKQCARAVVKRAPRCMGPRAAASARARTSGGQSSTSTIGNN